MEIRLDYRCERVFLSYRGNPLANVLHLLEYAKYAPVSKHMQASTLENHSSA